jgi:ATP-dependent DNA ligase
LLNLEGEDLRHLPLERRKERLETLVQGTRVRYSGPLPGSPTEIVPVLKEAGLEGVVAKRRDSIYAAHTRSPAWQKFKLSLAREFVIGGYNPEGNKFSSLLVGYYDAGGQLIFAGKVRQGFNPASRLKLMKILKPLATETCPFANLPINKRGHFGEGITEEDMAKLQWLSPKLVAQVSFTEWTHGGLLRHATFFGLRDDKDAKEVVRERI